MSGDGSPTIEETVDVAPAAAPVQADVGVETAVPSEGVEADTSGLAAPQEPDKSEAPSSEGLAAPEPQEAEPVDAYNENGGKPGKVKSFDRQSKEYYEAQAAGDMNLGGNGGGALYTESKEEKAKRQHDEMMDFIVEHLERAREQFKRKWDDDSHEFAGVSASGREWREMRDYIKSDSGKKRLKDELMRQGMSKEQAEQAARKAEEMQDLIQKMANGDKLTEAERLRLEELQRDRDVRQATQVARDQFSNSKDHTVKVSEDVDARAKVATNIYLDTAQTGYPVNSNTASTVSDSRAIFPTAAHLKEEFTVAKQATTPLDAHATEPGNKSAQLTVAVNTRQVSSTTNMDL